MFSFANFYAEIYCCQQRKEFVYIIFFITIFRVLFCLPSNLLLFIVKLVNKFLKGATFINRFAKRSIATSLKPVYIKVLIFELSLWDLKSFQSLALYFCLKLSKTKQNQIQRVFVIFMTIFIFFMTCLYCFTTF